MRTCYKILCTALLSSTLTAAQAADAPAPPAADPLKALAAIKPPPPPKVPPIEYFVSVDDKPAGPFPCAKILDMAKARTVTPETRVWKAGLENWQRAASLEEFKPIFAVVPPPVNGDVPPEIDTQFRKVPVPCPPPDDGKAPWWWPLPIWPF
jgi:hypothetical protein